MIRINATNINQAVAYANLTANKSAKRYLAYRICLPVCSTLFFLLSVILTYGAVELFVLRPLVRDGISADIYRIPILSELWNGLFYRIAFLLGTVTVWYRFAALCVALLFVVPMITALIIFLIVWLIYHPNTAQSDIHTYEDNIARKLYQKAEASAEYQWCDAKLILLFSLLFTVGALGLVIHIELVSLSPADRGEIISSTIINLFAGIICGGLISALYACLMYISLRLWERFVEPRMNTAFIDSCRDYWQKNDPDYIKQQTESKQRIWQEEQRRKQWEAQERQQRLEKEREERMLLNSILSQSTTVTSSGTEMSDAERRRRDDEDFMMDLVRQHMEEEYGPDWWSDL